MSLLDIRALEIAYGGIRAVRGIDLQVNEGEMVALIGANGAGKSSTLNCLGGLVTPTAGEVLYDGKPLSQMAAHQRIGKGLALVPEGRGIFPRLTVLENLQMGAFHRSDAEATGTDLERMLTLFPRLRERSTQLAGTLSGGEQQMLAIGRALMGRPKLLLLDEPSMGLAPLMVEKIFEVIREVAAGGVAILLVEQNARLALESSARAYVMESGSISLSGPAAELLQDERVLAAYLGH